MGCCSAVDRKSWHASQTWKAWLGLTMKSTLQASAITHHDGDKDEEQSVCSLLRCSKTILIVYEDSIPLPNTDAIPGEEDAVSQIAVWLVRWS